ncbi:MAG: hypothetical protein R3E84_15850 [Pseudomonadales bacterium]
MNREAILLRGGNGIEHGGIDRITVLKQRHAVAFAGRHGGDPITNDQVTAMPHLVVRR